MLAPKGAASGRRGRRAHAVILVTGSSGLVGRAVVRQLMGQGLPVRSLVHEAPMPRLSRFPGSEPEQVVGDVRDPGSLQAACEGVETVIHLVAVLRRRRDGDYRAINVEGTRNLLAAAEAAGARRFILVSALGATPDPRYAYAHSKWQAEELVRASSLAWTIFRPSLLFGEGGGFFEKLRQSLRFSPPGLAFVPRTQARFQPWPRRTWPGASGSASPTPPPTGRPSSWGALRRTPWLRWPGSSSG